MRRGEKKGKRKEGEEKKRKFEDSYLRYSMDTQPNHVVVGHLPFVIHEIPLIN
jgi:hypothetical protein